VGIKASRTSGIAPFTVFVEPVVSGWEVDDEYHDLDYKWHADFKGNAPATFDKCPAFFDQLWGRDRRIGYGPRMAFVYETPGTYELVLEVRDRKGRVKLSEPVTITANSRASFTEAQTFVVKTGKVAPEPGKMPSTSYGIFTSISAAVAAWGNRGPGQILLAQGDTYNEAVHVDSPSHRLHIGSWAPTASPGPRPFVYNTTGHALSLTNTGSEVSVEGIRTSSAADPSAIKNTRTEIPHAGASMRLMTRGTGVITVEDCEMLMGTIGLGLGGNVCISNCRVEGWRDHGGLWGDVEWIAIVGSVYRQDPKSPRQCPVGGGWGVRVARGSTNGAFILHCVDSFSNQSSDGPVAALQPMWRIFTHQDEDNWASNLSCVYCENYIAYPLVSDPARRQRHVVDKVVVATIPIDAGRALETAQSGITIRNAALIELETVRYGPSNNSNVALRGEIGEQ
jgi:hypothetical protein